MWKKDTYENFNLDIFEHTTNTSEPMKELVTKELLIFKCH
jgi:hypothetical protein